MLFGCSCVWNVIGAESDKVDENILAHAGAHASGDDRDFVHARAGVRDALLGAGCGFGPGVHADRVALSIFRDVSGMAGRGFDGSDTSSNVLFGSLQRITSQQL